MRFFKKSFVGVFLLSAILGGVHVLKAHEEMPAAKMPAEFDKVKSLVGTWKGTTEMGGKPMEVTNTFELTSGGSAVIEKIMAGTPHEMVSVYCAEGGKMVMTHYCSMGNQPKMSLKKNSDKMMDFQMNGTSGIASAKDAHMHQMKITWKDKDHISESWTMYMDGKAQPGAVFELARAK
jgi:hypothetical protein